MKPFELEMKWLMSNVELQELQKGIRSIKLGCAEKQKLSGGFIVQCKEKKRTAN